MYHMIYVGARYFGCYIIIVRIGHLK